MEWGKRDRRKREDKRRKKDEEEGRQIDGGKEGP